MQESGDGRTLLTVTIHTLSLSLMALCPSLVTSSFAWLSTETGDYAPLVTAMYILWP